MKDGACEHNSHLFSCYQYYLIDFDTVTNGINNMSQSNNNNATKEVGIIDDSNILPGMSTSSKKVEGASKSNDDTLEVIGQLKNMSTADNVSICANCGKEGAYNTCNKCKMVKYCNAVCKKVHKKKHKKECEEHQRRAAKLHDEKLFKQPPPQYGDCPICFVQLPCLLSGSTYMSCCGKVICSGCVHAMDKRDKEEKCPFCRVPVPDSDEDNVERLKIRMEAGDPEAMSAVGIYHRKGVSGILRDYTKALELWHQAGELLSLLLIISIPPLSLALSSSGSYLQSTFLPASCGRPSNQYKLLVCVLKCILPNFTDPAVIDFDVMGDDQEPYGLSTTDMFSFVVEENELVRRLLIDIL